MPTWYLLDEGTGRIREAWFGAVSDRDPPADAVARLAAHAKTDHYVGGVKAGPYVLAVGRPPLEPVPGETAPRWPVDPEAPR